MPKNTIQREDSTIKGTNSIPGKQTNKDLVPFGGFSFESDSLPDFSEFEGNTSGSDSQTENKVIPAEGKMAPVNVIETISISRPLKVIAFLCGFFASILLLMAICSSEWLLAHGYRQGMFKYCVTNLTQTRVPFVSENDVDGMTLGCHSLDLSQQAYTFVCGMFCIISLVVNVFATFLTACGLRNRDPNRKYKFYRVAVLVMTIALIGTLISLVVYPVSFSQIISNSDRLNWEFGWAYGVGWGSSIFLFGGILLLLCDKESEEIYYKERTIVYTDTEDKN